MQECSHVHCLALAGAASLGVIRVDDREHLETIYRKVCREVGSLKIDPKTGDFAHADSNEKPGGDASVICEVAIFTMFAPLYLCQAGTCLCTWPAVPRPP